MLLTRIYRVPLSGGLLCPPPSLCILVTETQLMHNLGACLHSGAVSALSRESAACPGTPTETHPKADSASSWASGARRPSPQRPEMGHSHGWRDDEMLMENRPGSRLCMPPLERKAGDLPRPCPCSGTRRLPHPWASLEDPWHQGLTCSLPPPSSASGPLTCCHGNRLKIKWAPRAQPHAQKSKQTN